MNIRYDFCPVCGRKTVLKTAGDDGSVPFCESCGRYWFDGFHTCVIVLILNEYGEAAISRQSYLSDKYATLTSGYITPGESAEECAAREAKEELGLDIENIEYSGSWWFDEKGILMLGFTAFSEKKDFVLSCEVDSASWVPAEEAGKYLFPDSPGNAAWGVLKNYLKQRGEGGR